MNSKKIFNINNVMNLSCLTSLIKFNIDGVIPKPLGMNLANIFLYLWHNWWFSWHMLSEMKSLPEKFSWVRTSDLLWRFFLLIRMLRFCFLHLNLTITVSFFSNVDMLEDLQASSRGPLETMPCKRCFQEYHYQ